MFQDGSSSSSEEAGPFHAIKAAADARRTIGLTDLDDPVYKAITEELNNPTPREKPAKPKRESRYIGKLVEKAAERKEESSKVSERRLVAKQREEDAIFADKERFVTSAYRRKLQNDRVKDELERKEEDAEEERRGKGIAGFYGKLFSGGNVAMGGKSEVADAAKTPGVQAESNSASQEPLRDEAAAKGDAATKVSKKRRRSRFSDAKTEPPTAGSEPQPGAEKHADLPKERAVAKKRGLRRNDEKSIEEYRRRYFERRAKRLAQKSNG